MCYVAATDGPGGPAHDLQRTLVTEFGHRQPVVAATTEMATVTDPGLRQWASRINDGGTWRTFSSGPARLLGEDLNRQGQWTSFSRHEVVSAPLVRDGRMVGVTFKAATSRGEGPDAAGRTTVVDADQVHDGRYVVSTQDGRTLAVDGDTFGKVVASSHEFSDAVAGAPGFDCVAGMRAG